MKKEIEPILEMDWEAVAMVLSILLFFIIGYGLGRMSTKWVK